MKKILLAGLLASSMFASTFPNYKTSMGLGVGTSSVLAETTNNSYKSNQLDYGMYFSMEEKFSGSHFYYGVGFDFDYFKFNLPGIENDLETSYFSLYPSLSYNFSKDFSIKGFVGLNYLDVETEIDNDTWGNTDIGYVYGSSVDYSLGTAVTNGLIYKHNINKLGQVDLETDILMYRIGIKF